MGRCRQRFVAELERLRKISATLVGLRNLPVAIRPRPRDSTNTSAGSPDTATFFCASVSVEISWMD